MQHPPFTTGDNSSPSTLHGASFPFEEPLSPTLSASASICELSRQFDRQTIQPSRQITSLEQPPSQLHSGVSQPITRNRASTTPHGSIAQTSSILAQHQRHKGLSRRKHSSAHFDRIQSIVHEMLRDSDSAPPPPWSPTSSYEDSTPSPTFSSHSSFSAPGSSSNVAGMVIPQAVGEEPTSIQVGARTLGRAESRYKIGRELRMAASREALRGEEMSGLVRKEIRLRKAGRKERLRDRVRE